MCRARLAVWLPVRPTSTESLLVIRRVVVVVCHGQSRLPLLLVEASPTLVAAEAAEAKRNEDDEQNTHRNANADADACARAEANVAWVIVPVCVARVGHAAAFGRFVRA